MTHSHDPPGWRRVTSTVTSPVMSVVAVNAAALAPQWLRTALHNRAAAIATRYEAAGEN